MGEENNSLLQVATVLDTDCIYTVLKKKKNQHNHQPTCKFSWLVAQCSLQYSLVTDVFLPPLNTTLKGD